MEHRKMRLQVIAFRRKVAAAQLIEPRLIRCCEFGRDDQCAAH
jgi:hypothetical protein